MPNLLWDKRSRRVPFAFVIPTEAARVYRFRELAAWGRTNDLFPRFLGRNLLSRKWEDVAVSRILSIFHLSYKGEAERGMKHPI